MSGLKQELFKKKRVADAERALKGGRQHGLIIADVFYGSVEGPDRQNQVLALTPRNANPTLIACLWSLLPGNDGEHDFCSAAITDESESEVAKAGHDRAIINTNPERLDTWRTPGPVRLVRDVSGVR